jgi:hypothetical protein
VICMVNLPLIGHRSVLHRKAHGQKSTVRGYPLLPRIQGRLRALLHNDSAFSNGRQSAPLLCTS